MNRNLLTNNTSPYILLRQQRDTLAPLPGESNWYTDPLALGLGPEILVVSKFLSHDELPTMYSFAWTSEPSGR